LMSCCIILGLVGIPKMENLVMNARFVVNE